MLDRHSDVSIHAPTWGATRPTSACASASSSFNPRAHVGRDHRRLARPWHIDRFNPRAHVGRDIKQPVFVLVDGVVSIHAPTWGATKDEGFAAAVRKFQSTRPRGARPHAPPRLSCNQRGFNPRAHVGRDRLAGDYFNPQNAVSIHAPTWGATSITLDKLTSFDVFQSTRPRGARLGANSKEAAAVMFQSTRPRGARPQEGRYERRVDHVSIHAPTWGATRVQGSTMQTTKCFNPRAHVGRDLHRLENDFLCHQVSIHAPTWGATYCKSSMI